jgi:hypothetical protein
VHLYVTSAQAVPARSLLAPFFPFAQNLQNRPQANHIAKDWNRAMAGANTCLWESAIPKELSLSVRPAGRYTPARHARVSSVLRSK